MTGKERQPVEDGAEKREQGVAMAFAGLAVLVAGLLVIFFAPASFRVQQRPAFTALIIALALLGAVMVLLGRRVRRTSK
jgi:uncharacterized membrane protein YqjE